MTDKLRQAAEMALYFLESGMPSDTYGMNKELYQETIFALSQALKQWTPDDTAYRPNGLSMPVDRGAWDGVEDVTQWLEELRGNETD